MRNKENIKNKEVILFCPSFFGYDEAIKKEIECLGANVHLYDERPFKSVLGKALLRFNLSWFISYYVERYYYKLLLPKIESVDYLVFINPESLSRKIIDKVRAENPNVKIVIYMWDSFDNKPRARDLIGCSQYFYTFDPSDAEKNKINFLPLFYTSDYAKIKDNASELYDFSFVGTAHSERYDIVSKIMVGGYKSFTFLYTPSKLVFLYKKYICRELRGLNYDDVSSVPMERSAVVGVIGGSHVVIDVNHPAQVGLTMRTIEVLGAGRKLITTNHRVVNYDFYNENNIFVYDGENASCIEDFFNKPYIDVDDDVYSKYSLNRWVGYLFGVD